MAEFIEERPAATSASLRGLASPAILGLYGFAGATFIVAAHLARWYGNTDSGLFLFPFAAMFGGVAQFLAGMWAYRARDGLGTAMHGMWGAFWMAYGLLNWLSATQRLAQPAPQFVELGYWFIVLAAITWAGAYVALAENMGLVTVLTLLAAGSSLLAIGFIAGVSALVTIAGWVLVFSALAAWYTATALMIEGSRGREVLPLGRRAAIEVQAAVGEPAPLRREPPARRVS